MILIIIIPYTPSPSFTTQCPNETQQPYPVPIRMPMRKPDKNDPMARPTVFRLSWKTWAMCGSKLGWSNWIHLKHLETFGGNWELMEISVPFNAFLCFFSPLWSRFGSIYQLQLGHVSTRFAEFGTNKGWSAQSWYDNCQLPAGSRFDSRSLSLGSL